MTCCMLEEHSRALPGFLWGGHRRVVWGTCTKYMQARQPILQSRAFTSPDSRNRQQKDAVLCFYNHEEAPQWYWTLVLCSVREQCIAVMVHAGKPHAEHAREVRQPAAAPGGMHVPIG